MTPEHLERAKRELMDAVSQSGLPPTDLLRLQAMIARIRTRLEYRLALHAAQAAIQRQLGRVESEIAY